MNMATAASLKLGDKVLVRRRGGEVAAKIKRINHTILPNESFMFVIESPLFGSSFAGMTEIRRADSGGTASELSPVGKIRPIPCL